MNFLLDVNSIDITKRIESISDSFLYGGRMLLIGMMTVFSVLIILWFTLSLFKLFFHDLAYGKKKIKEVKSESISVNNTSVTDNNDEIVAVIAAAIAMAESESGGAKFRVVSFRRK